MPSLRTQLDLEATTSGMPSPATVGVAVKQEPPMLTTPTLAATPNHEDLAAFQAPTQQETTPSANEAVVQMATAVSIGPDAQEALTATAPSDDLLAAFAPKPESGTLWWNADSMAEAKAWEADLLNRGAEKVEMKPDVDSERVRVLITLDRARAEGILGYPVEMEEWLIPENHPRTPDRSWQTEEQIDAARACLVHQLATWDAERELELALVGDDPEDDCVDNIGDELRHICAGLNSREDVTDDDARRLLDYLVVEEEKNLPTSPRFGPFAASRSVPEEVSPSDGLLTAFPSIRGAGGRESSAAIHSEINERFSEHFGVTERPGRGAHAAIMSHQVAPGGRELVRFMTLRATWEPETPTSNRYGAAVGFHGDPIDSMSFPNRAKAESWILSAIREELDTHLEDQGIDPVEDPLRMALRNCETLEAAASVLSGQAKPEKAPPPASAIPGVSYSDPVTEARVASAAAASVGLTAREYEQTPHQEALCHELALKSAADRGLVPWSDPRIVRCEREHEVDLEMRRL